MPRYSNLPIDSNIQAGDSFVATNSGADQESVQISVGGLGSFFASTNIASPSKDAFLFRFRRFRGRPSSGSIAIRDINQSIVNVDNSITQFVISNVDSTGVNVRALMDRLVGSDVKIGSATRGDYYSLFNITSISNFEGSEDEFVMTVTHILNSHGARFLEDTVLSISNFVSAGTSGRTGGDTEYLRNTFSEFDSGVVYTQDDEVYNVVDGRIFFYRAVTSSNIGESLSDTDHWMPLLVDTGIISQNSTSVTIEAADASLIIKDSSTAGASSTNSILFTDSGDITTASILTTSGGDLSISNANLDSDVLISTNGTSSSALTLSGTGGLNVTNISTDNTSTQVLVYNSTTGQIGRTSISHGTHLPENVALTDLSNVDNDLTQSEQQTLSTKLGTILTPSTPSSDSVITIDSSDGSIGTEGLGGLRNANITRDNVFTAVGLVDITGRSGQYIRVNSGSSGLEYHDLSTDLDTKINVNFDNAQFNQIAPGAIPQAAVSGLVEALAGESTELRIVEEGTTTPVAYEDVILIGGSGVDLTVGTQIIGTTSYSNVVNIQFDPSEAGVSVNNIVGTTTTPLTGHLRLLQNAYGITLTEPVANTVDIGVTPNLFAKEQDFLNINTHSLTDWPVAGTITRTGNVLFTDAQLGVGQPDDANVVNRTAYHEHNRELLVDIDDGTAIPSRGQLIAKYSEETGGTLQWYGKVTASNNTTRTFWVQIIQGHDYLEEAGNSQQQVDGSLDFNGNEANRLYLLQYLFVATADDEVGMLSLNQHHNLIVRELSDSATPATGNAARYPNEGRVNELIAADTTTVKTNAIPRILTSDIAEATIPVTITATTTVDVGLGADYASISQQVAQRQSFTLYKRSNTGDEHRVFVRFAQLDPANQAITCTIDSREGTFTSEQTGPWSLSPSWAGTGTGAAVETINASNVPETVGEFEMAFDADNHVRYFIEYTLPRPGRVTLELYGEDHDLNGGNVVSTGTHTETFLASDLSISVIGDNRNANDPIYGTDTLNLRLSISYTDSTSEIVYVNYALGNRGRGVQFATQEELQNFISNKEEFRTNIGLVDAELRAETDLPIVTRQDGNPTLSTTTTYNLQGFRYHTTGNNRSFELDVNGRVIQTFSIENGAFEETFTLTSDDISFIEGRTDLDVRLTPTAAGSTLRSIIVTRIGSGADFFAGRIRVNASAFSRNLAAIDVGESGMLTLTADNLNALRSLGSISGLTLDVSTTENTVLYQFKMKITGFSTVSNTITGDITYINQALANTTLTNNPTSWIVTFGGFAQETVTQPEPPSELQADLPATAGELVALQRYKGRYTLHAPEASAPDVSLYGRPDVTIPAVLPSTVGTHEFLIWWTDAELRAITDNNGDDAAVYGTTGSNLSLVTSEGSFRFTDNYANRREDIEALQQRVDTLETEFQQVIHDVHADEFDFVTYPWAFWTATTTSTIENTFDNFQTLSIFRGNRRPQFGGSASNIDSLIQSEASALSDTTSQYAVVSFNGWDGTTEDADAAIGFVLDGSNPQTDQWQLYYTPGFSDSIPGWRRARVTFYATEALFLAARVTVSGRESQLLIPGTRAQIDDLIAHFGTNTEQHANVQVRYFLDGNTSVQAGEVMAVNSNGGIPFTNPSYRNLHYIYLQLVGITSTIEADPNQPIDVFIDRNGIVGQRISDIVEQTNGTRTATRINQDGTTTDITIDQEIIYRSEYDESGGLWENATPDANLGGNKAFGVDDTGTGPRQAWIKVGGVWSTTSFVETASPVGNIETTGVATNVRLQPATTDANFTIGLKGNADFAIEDVDTFNGGDARALAWFAIQLGAGTPTDITSGVTSPLADTLYLRYSSRYNGSAADFVDTVNTATGASVTYRNITNYADPVGTGIVVPRQ